jgi:hypothetical protein
VGPVIRHRDRFGEALRLIIDPPRTDRVHVTPIGLGLRMHQRITIHLGGRGEQEPRALRLGQAQRVVRAQRPDLQGLDRVAQVVHRAGRRGEVQHAVQIARHVRELRDIVPDELEAIIRHQMGDVVRMPGEEVVHPHHRVPIGEEAVR